MSFNPIKDILDKRGEAMVMIKIDEDVIIKKSALRVILYHLKDFSYTLKEDSYRETELNEIIKVLEERLNK